MLIASQFQGSQIDCVHETSHRRRESVELVIFPLSLSHSILLLERHDSIAEAAIGIASPHRTEGLQESNAVSALAEGKRPQRRVLYQRPRDVPIVSC